MQRAGRARKTPSGDKTTPEVAAHAPGADSKAASVLNDLSVSASSLLASAKMPELVIPPIEAILPDPNGVDSAGSDTGMGVKVLTEEARRERIRIRQERNRLAAKKCRERKQQYYDQLEKELAQIKQENAALVAQLAQMHKELTASKEKL